MTFGDKTSIYDRIIYYCRKVYKVKRFKLFRSSNERYIKKIQKIVKKINELEPEFEPLTDEQLRQKTAEFKDRLNKGETLDDLLPEAFAVVREAAKRTLHQRHYDVQLIGGVVLHRGQIAEMKTGEGKTLVSTLAVYLNALSGKGVHVVTVNDYLAKRDSEWMGQIYRFLGLTVGCVLHDMDHEEKKKAYLADITYGTNSEFGFDYLRDNMCYRMEDMVQRPFSYAIVDEVDSILIDEARTPLIISGQAQDSSDLYRRVDAVMCNIRPEHFEKDEKFRQISLTEAGIDAVEGWLRDAGLMTSGSLYDVQNLHLVRYVEQALQAHQMFTRDVDYIVKDDQVMIIDEFTGRIMAGRRYSEGLHQALEAKEHVSIQSENQTVASITYQNYFRMYPKLAGMTGTAMTESGEFDSTYHLTVVEIPTHLPVIRVDQQDRIYATAKEKYKAIIREIQEAHNRHQPVLVGTTSVEKSEILSNLLQEMTDIRFEVLNAKNHEREAMIVAEAGAPDAVTIATNMAGRGTDIQLGGNLDMRLKAALEGVTDEKQIEQITQKIKDEVKQAHQEVLAAGGLYVIGTERHENRRIDNQLRGRSGRQGDPGMSVFYVSMEDDLMRIFGPDRLKRLLKTFRIPDGELIQHPWITKAIETAQKKIETFHFDARKNLLKYDDVMNDQRKVIYQQRRELVEADSVHNVILDMRHSLIQELIWSAMPEKSNKDEWDLNGLTESLKHTIAIEFPITAWVNDGTIKNQDEMIEKVTTLSDKIIDEQYKLLDKNIEKNALLQVMSIAWRDHLQALENLKRGIGLRSYAQKDPLNEYRQEGFYLFENMLNKLKEDVTRFCCQLPLMLMKTQAAAAEEEKKLPDDVDLSKVGRNDPCPCGSGKKFKHCHGALK